MPSIHYDGVDLHVDNERLAALQLVLADGEQTRVVLGRRSARGMTSTPPTAT